ncbi:hypothetical protein [Isoptericola sp. BMS4]|uniref:hypothetical protein n=1 Tax=Isoptericola sp. BMS4 TaxID=2527875 RepID=UPI0014201445|nr:hypothetical protein [Isoptericola sp. BMS4]
MRLRKKDCEPLARALDVVVETLTTVGSERIAQVTLTRGRICLQPADLSEGERIATTLGCDVPLDHRMIAPGFTDWSGERDGLELHVRGALRDPVGAPA